MPGMGQEGKRQVAARLSAACLSGCLVLAAVTRTLQQASNAAVDVSAAPLDVVFNEIAWMGTAADYRDEWIELYNNAAHDIDLTGWSIVAGDGTPAVSLTGAIPAGGFFLLERGDDSIGDLPADLVYTGALENDPAAESLALLDGDGQVVDTANGDGGQWPAGDSAAKRTMERVDPAGTDSGANWCTNDGLTRNGSDAAGNPVQGTPGEHSSCYSPPGLSLIKTGPRAATSGQVLTYHLALANTGSETISSVIITDALPSGTAFAGQRSPFPFWQPSPGLLRWELDDLAPGSDTSIVISLQVGTALSGTLTNVATAAYEGVARSSSWSAAVHPPILLYALAPGSYEGSGEAIALINAGAFTYPLSGWSVSDDANTRPVSLPTGATLAPGQIAWLAQDADAFYRVWGFDAAWAAQALTRPVQALEGSWPAHLFTDAGESAYLLDPEDNAVDALAYGTGSADCGWSGPSVPHPYAGYITKQVLYRKLDQSTGLPVADTDRAADWAQDPDDPVDGRRLRLPGWDLEVLYFPAELTAAAGLTLAAAPDAALDVVSETIASAHETLRIEAYTLESLHIYNAIEERIQAGVTVTILLESGPTGGFDDTGRWIAERLHDPPSSTVYFMGAAAPRYRCQHAKFILVDDALALVSTDNFAKNSMPSDPKGNGTFGQRGFVAVTDSPGVVARLAEVFSRDCDAGHHLDVVPYDSSYAPPAEFVPLESPDWTSYSAPFTGTLVTTATRITVLHSPENALRSDGGLLGLLSRAGAGDSVALMQMSEPITWTTDKRSAGLNPRVQALLAAARRGATVRILLDSYYDDEEALDGNTAACLHLNLTASREELNLSCRLGNVTGLGIHAKVFAIRVGEERWVHLGSINGTESSNKANREVALQVETPEGYGWLLSVFEHDWQLSAGPLTPRCWLPVVYEDYVFPSDHPLVSEVLVNPVGQDASAEWIELFNPGDAVDVSGWMLGDALRAGSFGDGLYTFPIGTQLARGQVVAVAACATHFAADYGFLPDYEWTGCSADVADLEPAGTWDGFGLALGNTTDEVLLLAAGGETVDSLAWGGAPRAGVLPFMDYTSTLPSGRSLKRYPPASDRNDCSRDFYVSSSPSPGAVPGGKS